MKKTLAAGLAALSMAVVAAPASAATPLPSINLNPLTCTPDNRLCTAGFTVPVNFAGDFSQLITFTLPFSGNFNGTVTTDAASPLLDIDFTSIAIGSQAYTKDVGDPNERWSLVDFFISSGTHQLNLIGTSAGLGTFSGTISFAAAVPEPATWAFMILGFGAIGAAMRRRPKASVSLRYA